MDVNAKVDIGQNLTSLLERLAQQIGTTTDKVFPWYVQQAYLEGITTIVAFVVAFLVCIVVFIFSFKRAKFEYDSLTLAEIVAMVSGLGLAITLFGMPLAGVEAVRKVMNPNYYAMQSFTRDIGRLAGR